MSNSADPAFVDAELRLALYYNGLRDKIAALNVAVVGFSFPVYEKLAPFKVEFFGFLMALGIFSFIASLRSGIAYNFHFRNYEDYIGCCLTTPADCRAIFEENRKKYLNEKGAMALLTFGLTYIPTYVFWSVAIGLFCPLVALFVYHPW